MNASSDRAADGSLRADLITDIHSEALRVEQAKILYRQLPPLLAFHALVAAAMVLGLWDTAERGELVAWLSMMLTLIVLRLALGVSYRYQAGSHPGQRWRVWFTLGAGAAGTLWGLGAAALLPADSPTHQLFVLFVLVGMGAGAVASLTAYMPAFYAYLPASLLPAGIVLLAAGGSLQVALGLTTCVSAAALLLFGRTINRSLTESLTLRFANVELVKQLSEQRDEAQRANVGKSVFLAAASHDLRQPLHALALFASALDERIKYPEVRRIVDNINVAIRALERLFGALLDISRLDAGVLHPEVRSFVLDDLLLALVNEYTGEAQAKGLHLRYSRTEHTVRSDPALLERILRNYLSNAIRYTERGGVRVACCADGERIRIDVVDTGIGIPAAQHAAIFQEFHQLGNPERDRAKGFGLGLAIVERVARLLGHPIGVGAVAGGGSRFSVSVPAADPSTVTAVEPAPASDPRGDLADLCVIVVDDESSVREGTAILLAQWGCRVFTAASEDEAVEVLRAAPARPEVILADYRLRGGRTGVEAIARLRAEFGADLPALIVTGDTVPEHLREARASGHALVHKPAEPAMLRAFLRNASRGRHAG